MNIIHSKLIQKIQIAFKNVKLEDGVSLNMTEYKDSSGSIPEYKEKSLLDERNDWSAIPDSTLEQFTVTFSFTDLKGFRFYIPAYMIWTIKNFDKSNSIIGNFTIYAIDPNHYIFDKTSFTDWFTREQITVMCSFLEFALQQNNMLDERVASQNLEEIRKLTNNQTSLT